MTRRSIVALCSVCIHAVILVFAMTADLWRPISEWPTPRSAMAFETVARPVHVEDIQAPRTGARRPSGPSSSLSPAAPEAAPVLPPAGVADETGGERRFSDLPPGPAIGNAGDLTGIGTATPSPAPPPPPQPPTPVRLHSGIRAPQRLVHVAPVYPVIAQSARVQGVVIIEATLDERGNVVRADILRSIPLLDAAALDAVRQWKFTPTLLNGIAVPIVMTVTVNFTLQ